MIIPDTVTSVDEYTFSGWQSLEAVVIPDSVSTIGWSAFYSCKNLKNVVLPNSLVSIKSSAFSKCDSLTNIYYGGTISDWSIITIDSYNETLEAALCYYCEVQPTDTTYQYWHYVDGVPTKW